MTISEEKKTKIFELYKKGLSKKEISRTVQVSYTTIRSILNEGNTEQIQEEKKKIVEKKLNEIFEYENYTDETIVNLIFNLKRIGELSGRELGEFIEDIEFLFDIYYKMTENTIRMFDFCLDISNNLSLLSDCVEPEAFLKIVEEIYKRGIYLNELEAYVSEQKQKSDELIDNKTKELTDLSVQIDEYKNEIKKLESTYALFVKNYIEDPNKENLKEALEKIAHLETVNRVFREKGLSLEKELEKSDKENEITKRENLLFRTLIEVIKEKHPNELKETIEEVNVKDDKETHNTAKEKIVEKKPENENINQRK